MPSFLRHRYWLLLLGGCFLPAAASPRARFSSPCWSFLRQPLLLLNIRRHRAIAALKCLVAGRELVELSVIHRVLLGGDECRFCGLGWKGGYIARSSPLVLVDR
jgi:hypothetical protein